ncbi:recombinase family protein [Vibrio ulleungensis]|uniref:Recombinase family protein n=1 Tax=Vibrio ulleungensis TaxID=2807619 RepID=A0ABS2HNA5_9VIBR|nr:recombinase family protein [Vibrio ulleungensis]MBM7038539.1 recombinase family protein [Vibrio ulleungensis]
MTGIKNGSTAKGTEYIYARVSTQGQELATQTEELMKHYPDAVVVSEKISTRVESEQFDKLLGQMEEGDKLIAYDLSRLGRDTGKLLELAQELEARGIGMVIHNLGGQSMDTTTATGKFLFTVLAAMGQMQRDIQNEKTRLGVQRAKEAGKMKGGRPHKTDNIKQALGYLEKGLSKEAAAKAAGIGVATLYRALRANKSA